MNGIFAKLTGMGIALALSLTATTAGVNAQAWNHGQPVTDSMLLDDAALSWLHANGNLAGHRYSVLTNLNPSNAGDLRVAWMFSPGGDTDAWNTPLYHDGLVYFAQDNSVLAIDAVNGQQIWRYRHELPESFGGYRADPVTGKHLGLAVYGHNIYFLSNDAKLHAIHFKTGQQVFVRQYGDHPQHLQYAAYGGSSGYAATAGVKAIPGMVLVPLAGTDFSGLPGFVLGVDPEDGEVLWECNLNPTAGHDRWPGESPEYDSGPWGNGSWDADLKMYYTGTANTDSWNPKFRGDHMLHDLGAASVAACSTETGKLAWRAVMDSGDQSDLDTMQTPMIIDVDGRKTIVLTRQSGDILYLDAASGGFRRTPEYPQRLNWIAGYDVEGRPVGRWDLRIEDGNALDLWPNPLLDWNVRPNAYSPLGQVLYLAAANGGRVYMVDGLEPLEVTRDIRHFGASLEFTERYEGPWILAMDVTSGAEVWHRPGHAGGMLATAGNLVFYTDHAGEFHATNATTGEPVYTFHMGARSKTGPITYMVAGKQYVLQPVGKVLGWGIEERRLDRGSLLVAFSR